MLIFIAGLLVGATLGCLAALFLASGRIADLERRLAPAEAPEDEIPASRHASG